MSLRQHATMHAHSKLNNHLNGLRDVLPTILNGLYKHKDWTDLQDLYYQSLDWVIKGHHYFWPLLVARDFVRMFLQNYSILYDPSTQGLESVRCWVSKDEDFDKPPYDDLLTLADAVRVRKIRKFLREVIRVCKEYYSKH